MNDFTIQQTLIQSQRDALAIHNDEALNRKMNAQRLNVVFITPENEIERLEAYDDYQGNENKRRTAKGKYPNNYLNQDNKIVQISYSVLNPDTEVVFVAKSKDKFYYIANESIVLELVRILGEVKSPEEFLQKIRKDLPVIDESTMTKSMLDKSLIEELQPAKGYLAISLKNICGIYADQSLVNFKDNLKPFKNLTGEQVYKKIKDGKN